MLSSWIKYLTVKKIFCSILILTSGLTPAAIYLTTDDFMAELARLPEKGLRAPVQGSEEHALLEKSPFEKALQLAQAGNFTEALVGFKKLSDEGNENATYALAMLHRLGLGVDQSDEAAQKLFQKSADRGHPISQVELAKLLEKEEPQKALALFQQAGKSGQPVANLKLGHCFETGSLGVPKNPELALNYYEKSAQAGMPVAQVELARCYDMGIGTLPDLVKATRLYRDAASNGAIKAQFIMANRLFEGKGARADRIRAVTWLEMAAKNGLADAQVLLGDCYEKGDGVEQDYGQAGRYYSAAAKQGNPLGRQRLARLYTTGKGTDKDVIRAYVLLAPAKGHPLVDQDLKELIDSISPDQLKTAQEKLAEIEDAVRAGKK